MEIIESIGKSKKPMEIADSSKRIEESRFQCAATVNVSNFVSAKLSDKANYRVWEAQMVCLMKSHKMFGIVDSNFDGPDATTKEIRDQYDNLLKGWIFGSISEDILKDVADIETAIEVWRRIKKNYVEGHLQGISPIFFITLSTRLL